MPVVVMGVVVVMVVSVSVIIIMGVFDLEDGGEVPVSLMHPS